MDDSNTPGGRTVFATIDAITESRMSSALNPGHCDASSAVIAEAASGTDQHLEYWTRKLDGVVVPLQIPTDCPRRPLRAGLDTTARVHFKLSAALTQSLRSLARHRHVSLFETLASSWAVLLGRLSDQEEILLGTRTFPCFPSQGGHRVEVGENVVALRIAVNGGSTVEHVLKNVERAFAEAREHWSTPWEHVEQRLANAGWGASLLQVFISMNEELAQRAEPAKRSRESTPKYELNLALEDRDVHVRGTLEYVCDFFDLQTIERMVDSWKVLLKGLVKHAKRPISLLPILTASERQRVLYRFNETEAAYPRQVPVHALFEERVATMPERIAVEFGSQTLTYSQLNARANRLARYLRARGVGPDKAVAVCLERGIEMVVSLLGILKAGGAYVPLDPNYPPMRLTQMLDDARPQALLTQNGLKSRLSTTSSGELIVLEEVQNVVSQQSDENLVSAERTADDLVYVIYTSGSTGRPKGVAMTHRSMVNLVEWHRKALGTANGVRALQFAALSFDVAFQEIFSTLCTGGTLVMIEEQVRRDVGALLELLTAYSIERLFVPPLMLQSLARYSLGAATAPIKLKDIIAAGEQLRIGPEIVSFFQRLPLCRLHNHYGPTETHVVTAFTLSGDPAEWPSLPPIGKPIANTQIYVLDGRMQPVPVGVNGEMYIGGVGVARGYLHRRELTAERFLPDPFSSDPMARLYKVGDLGRWRADGSLEYLCRNDDQVKIRGFRVELGEIEAQLSKHPHVKEIAVVAREGMPGQKQLVAYITLHESGDLNAEAMRNYLKSSLPEYMVPSAFVALDRLPLTPSGKLDRRSLPAPKIDAFISREYDPPRGEVEKTLSKIWQDLLTVERVGRQDNFFELGGHSLLIVELLERLRAVGLSVQAQAIYEARSLADLASCLAMQTSDVHEVPPNLIPKACSAITPEMLSLVRVGQDDIARIEASVHGGAENIQDIYPLAPLQEGILFHHLMSNQGRDPYVLPILLSMSSRDRVDAFAAALQKVIDRHDMLRTALLWENLARPLQIVHRRARLPVEELVVERNRDIVDQLRAYMDPLRQRLDLHRAPMMRLQVAEDEVSGQWYGVLQLHHLLCDHESLEMMIREISYCIDGRAEELPVPVQYREHVAQALARSEAAKSDAFFRAKLGDVDEPTAPFGLLDVKGEASRIEEHRFVLEDALAKRVRSAARHRSVSVATLFHATWALVVSMTSGREDVVFGTVLSGRMQSTPGAKRVMGMFINTLPIRLRLANCSVAELVDNTRQELVELMAHEQAALAVAQRSSGLSSGASGPLFSAFLNCLQSSLHLETERTEIATGIESLELQEWTNYPFALTVDDQGDKFVLRAKTDRSVDPGRVMAYVRVTLQSLVDALETAPDTPASLLRVLPEIERQQVIELFNATQSGFPEHKLLHELFEEQVDRTPSAIAVEFDGHALTYAQLDRRATQLAHHLRGKDVGPDQLVAIAIDRSVEAIVAILGVLKAGGAYVPLDTTNPIERIEHVLADAQPRVLITLASRSADLPQTTAEVVLLDKHSDDIEKQRADRLDARAMKLEPRNLAYVIYTSGSTGKPKGVMIEHRNIVNYALYAARVFDVASGNGSLICTSISFDLMLTGLYPTLLSGRTIRLCREYRGLPELPDEVLRCTGLAPLKLTPSHLSLLDDALASGQLAGRVRSLVLGGEPLRSDTVLRWMRHAPGTRVFNHYGPTEATVGCIVNEVTSVTSETVPLGRPISNTRIYILDARMRPVPVGVTGEIYIGGAGVARGYWNRPDLTEQRFVTDPFTAEPNHRLYRSGDLGRWRADGLVEYLGRNDQQVKIRGFRVEPGEIESQLARHPLIKEVAVIPQEDTVGGKRIVAYIVLHARVDNPTDASDVDPSVVEALRAHSKGVLPDYMVPSAFMLLSRLPLTPNGKLDRRSLPVPDFKAIASRAYESPVGEVEELVASIWRDLLRVERVGRHDNFFELGGHSLLAMQLLVRLRSAFTIEATLRLPFDYPVLHQLCLQVEDLRNECLLESLEYGGEQMEVLLERVGSLPESRVSELIRELRGER